MGKIKSTFQRYEKKYLLDENKYYKFLNKIEDKMRIDDYG